MLREHNCQQSFYSFLYERVLENHLLKKIEKAIDFSFINDLLSNSYCKNNGRPAKEPELMMKLLLLQHLYTLSDVRVIEEANCNLAFLWFLGLNPEDTLPDASLLAKFRVYRLKEFSLDEMITEIVRQCVESGLIKGSGITIDSTHIAANTNKKVPERIMKQLARRIFKALYKDRGYVGEEIDTCIPDYTQIGDEKQAKQIMKAYLEKIILACDGQGGDRTHRAIDEARGVLADDLFLVQKGIRSLVDKDARVGRKSKEQSFYGYKTEYMMTADERIITAIETFNGAYVDGTSFSDLLSQTQQSGVAIKDIYGDKAYFRAKLLQQLRAEKITPYIPVSA